MTNASACCDSCATGAQDTALAFACTLGVGGFKERVAGIPDLSRRGLRNSRRDPLRLHLTYTVDAFSEVQDLVPKGSDGCSFLGFDLQHDADAARLTITAPVEALMVAEELFAHFAPELAREAA